MQTLQQFEQLKQANRLIEQSQSNTQDQNSSRNLTQQAKLQKMQSFNINSNQQLLGSGRGVQGQNIDVAANSGEVDLNRIQNDFHSETRMREIVQEIITPLANELLTCQRSSKHQANDIRKMQDTQKNLDADMILINKRIVDQAEIKKQMRIFELQMQSQEMTLKKRHEKMKDVQTQIRSRIGEINQQFKTLELSMYSRDEKIEGLESTMNNHRDKLQTTVISFQEQTRRDINKMEKQIREFDASLKEIKMKVGDLVENLQRQMVDNLTDIFNKFKAEEDRYDVVMKKVQDFPKMQTELKQLMQRLKHIEKEQWSSFEESFFVERCVPMLIHFQISEALQNVLQGEDQYQKPLLEYENKKVKEIHEYYLSSQNQATNIRSFKNRLLFLMRTYFKESKGVYSFQYGRDYRPDMPDEEIDYINQAVYVSMEERMKLIGLYQTNGNKKNLEFEKQMSMNQQLLQQQIEQGIKSQFKQPEQQRIHLKSTNFTEDYVLEELKRVQHTVEQKLREIEVRQIKSVKSAGGTFQNYYITKKFQIRGMPKLEGKSRSKIRNLSQTLARLEFNTSKEFLALKNEISAKLMEAFRNENIDIIELNNQAKDLKNQIGKPQGISKDEIEKLQVQLEDRFRKQLHLQLDHQMERSEQDLKSQKQIILELNQQLSKLQKESEKQNEFNERKSNELGIDISQIRETLKYEYDDFFQNRKKIKADINYDNSMTQNKIFEFEKSLQSFDFQLSNLNLVLNLLLETQQIEHLMVTQDLEDRKQIGIFGQKKNSEILGNSSQFVSVSKGFESAQKSSVGTGFSKQVQSSHQHNRSKTQEQANNLCKPSQSNQSPKQQQRNSIFVDKNCISCSGNSSVILQHIKVACLSYQNNPVTYKGSVLNMHEINDIKQSLLNECQKLIEPADIESQQSKRNTLLNGEVLTQSRFRINKSAIMEDSQINRKNHVVQVPNLTKLQYIDLKTSKLKQNEDAIRAATPTSNSMYSTMKNQTMQTITQGDLGFSSINPFRRDTQSRNINAMIIKENNKLSNSAFVDLGREEENSQQYLGNGLTSSSFMHSNYAHHKQHIKQSRLGTAGTENSTNHQTNPRLLNHSQFLQDSNIQNPLIGKISIHRQGTAASNIGNFEISNQLHKHNNYTIGEAFNVNEKRMDHAQYRHSTSIGVKRQKMVVQNGKQNDFQRNRAVASSLKRDSL
eukprot:403345926